MYERLADSHINFYITRYFAKVTKHAIIGLRGDKAILEQFLSDSGGEWMNYVLSIILKTIS